MITVHHSSSSIGNLYQVGDLLIDSGVSITELKRCLSHRLHEVRAALLSHEHGDHSRATKDLMRLGVDCYMTQGTRDALKLNGHRVHSIEADRQFTIGPWAILPFHTVHNAADPVGFLLQHDSAKILYAIDSQYVPHRFRGLTHVMIECDYDMTILKNNLKAGTLDMEVARGAIQNHMSLDTVKGFFQANDMSKVEEIHLLHLSRKNSNAAMFKREIQQLTGRSVYVGRE